MILVSILIVFSLCKKEENTPTECEQNCALEPQIGFGNAAIPNIILTQLKRNVNNLHGAVWEE